MAVKHSPAVARGLREVSRYPVPTVADLERVDAHVSDILKACAQHDERMDGCESYEDREEEMGGFVHLMIVKAASIRRALGMEDA